jgi:hypothetical protein
VLKVPEGDVLTSGGVSRSVLKAVEDGALEKRKSPGRSLGVIGGERERRRSAPDSLIVRRFSFAPTD